MDTLHLFVEKLRTLRQHAPSIDGHKNINTQALFSALLTNELRAQAGLAADRQADDVTAQYFKAVLLCRQNELAAAHVQLVHADELLLQLPTMVLDFVTLFKLSAWGNYYYKAGQGARGIEALRQGLQLSADLERRGYQALIYRRIEQLQNIANIHYKQHEYEQANQLLKNTLRFIHSDRAAGLLIEDWDAGLISRISPLQESTLRGFVHLIADQNTVNMNHPVYDNAYYYSFFYRELLQELETTTYNRLVLFNWLYTKNSYFEQGPTAFLHNVVEFIADSAITPLYDGLKANLLAQAIWSIRQQTSHADPQPLIASIRGFAEANLTDKASQSLRLAA